MTLAPTLDPEYHRQNTSHFSAGCVSSILRTHKVERERAPASCPLTFIHVLCGTRVCVCMTHTSLNLFALVPRINSFKSFF